MPEAQHGSPQHSMQRKPLQCSVILMHTQKTEKLLIIKMPLTNGMAVSEMRSHKLLTSWLSKTLFFHKMFYNIRCWYKY